MRSPESPVLTVLFVDDDPTSLDHIKTSFDALNRPWIRRYASSSREALTNLEFNGSVDVIVVSQAMESRSGHELLAKVRQEYPQTVRIAVCNAGIANDDISAAHRFLTGPVDLMSLSSAIDASMTMRGRVDDAVMRSLLGTIDVLPSPSRIVLELSDALAHPDSSIDTIAGIIATDPAMSAKLLQLVNSAYFGLPSRVTSISNAASYLGLSAVHDLLTAVEMIRAFTPRETDLMVHVEQLHNHSLTVAELARTFTNDRRHVHDAFTAGMLHDIGLLAVISCAPERFIALQNDVSHGSKSFEECEQDVLGASHAAVGAYLSELWGLPYVLTEAIARSHDANLMTDHNLTITHAVFVAEQVVNTLGRTPGPLEPASLPDTSYLADIGLLRPVTDMITGMSLWRASE